MSTCSFQRLVLDDYFQATIDAIDPSFALRLQRQHCKSLLKSLLGLSSIEYDERIRNFKSQCQYKASVEFVQRHWPTLVPQVSPDDAPQFPANGLSVLEQSYREAPSKFFSFVTRGRVFQGKFERLLQSLQSSNNNNNNNNNNKDNDTAADLMMLEEYRHIFENDDNDRNDEQSEQDFLRNFVHEQAGDDKDLLQNLLACLDLDYANTPSQPADGGRKSGQKGEVSLLSYLQQQQQKSTDDESLQILSPVWIQAQSHKPPSPRCKNVIQLPKDINLHGLTTELDAAVVRIQGDTVTLVQVWEAKATLNPSSFRDALSKKGRAIQTIMEHHESSCLIIMTPDQQQQEQRQHNKESQRLAIDCSQTPRLGIFGRTLMPPSVAARQCQVILAEQAMETDTDTVHQALQTGQVPVPYDRVVASIRHIQHLAQQWDPIVILSAEVTPPSQES